MRITLLILSLLLLCQSVSAVVCEGYVITNEKDTLVANIIVPTIANKYQEDSPDYPLMMRKMVFLDDKNQALKFFPEEILAFGFVWGEELIQFQSVDNSFNADRFGVSDREMIFLRVTYYGNNANLYEFSAPKILNDPARAIFTRGDENRFYNMPVVKIDNRFYLLDDIQSKRALAALFEDCKNLYSEIREGSLRKRDIMEIVVRYNDCNF